jgi:hypothetical protein
MIDNYLMQYVKSVEKNARSHSNLQQEKEFYVVIVLYQKIQMEEKEIIQEGEIQDQIIQIQEEDFNQEIQEETIQEEGSNQKIFLVEETIQEKITLKEGSK